MADSMVLAKTFELLGSGVPSTLPQCAGALFRLGRGYDLGDPQSVIELLTTLMGDGSKPVGWRADNRTVSMPVTIQVPPTGNLAADRLTLAAARDLLLEAIAVDQFTLVWAPDGQAGQLNLVWDCFRAKASSVTHDIILDKQLISELTITFDALPFGRSDTLATVFFDNPLVGQTPAPQPLTVDDYSALAAGWGPFAASGGGTSGGALPGYFYAVTAAQAALIAAGDTFKVTAGPNSGAAVYTVTVIEAPFAGFCNVHFTPVTPGTPSASDTLTSTQAAWWTQSPVAALFTSSARWHHDLTDQNSPLAYKSAPLGGTVNLTGMGKLTFWLGLGSDPGRWRYWRRNTPVTVIITLTDASARTLSFSTRAACNASEDQELPKWNQVSLTIPQGRAFTYSAVTRYQLTAWSEVHTWNHATELDVTGYLSALRAIPAAGPKRPASARGGEYVLYDIIGTAPAPINIQCQLGYLEQTAVTQSFWLPGTPGATSTYTAPQENPNWLASDSGGFEQGTTGAWTGSDGAAANATLAASQTQVHSGAWSLRMTAAAAGSMLAASTTAANVAAQGVPCAAGDRIAVRAWVRASSTARSVVAGCEFFNASGTTLGVVALSGVTDSSSAWTQVSGRVTAPANAASGRLTVQVVSAALGEIHYVDDAYLAYAVQATVACKAAGGAGGTVEPSNCAGGGAGSGEIAWETSLDLNPGLGHSYTVGKGGLYNKTAAGRGGDGGNSSFTGASLTVLAHGGLGGANCIVADYANGAGGAGGSGSTNAHHNNGGAGATGDRVNFRGGGAGGPAGDGGAGQAGGSVQANTPGQGGSPGALGLGGGQGGIGAAGRPVNFGSDGSTGQGVGAGGGGAACQSHERLGANGQAGGVWVQIKTYTTQGQFPALLVHKLSGRAGILAKPVIEVGGSLDPPDGREYTIDDVDGQNAMYRGTYTCILSAWSWNGTAARTVTVTIRQYAGGVSAGTAQVSASVTPAQVVNGMVVLGELQLPVLEVEPDNTDAYFTVAVTSANSSDLFLDVLLIDTQGSTYWVSNASGGGFVNYYIDAPDTTADLGLVLGSNGGRASAVSVLGSTFASGGPLRLEPGDNVIAVYSPAGQPSLYGEYFPRWWHARLA